jgi:hypothetical protein
MTRFSRVSNRVTYARWLFAHQLTHCVLMGEGLNTEKRLQIMIQLPVILYSDGMIIFRVAYIFVLSPVSISNFTAIYSFTILLSTFVIFNIQKM